MEGKGEDWESIVLNAMKGLAVVPICEYAMEFERLIKGKRREKNGLCGGG